MPPSSRPLDDLLLRLTHIYDIMSTRDLDHVVGTKIQGAGELPRKREGTGRCSATVGRHGIYKSNVWGCRTLQGHPTHLQAAVGKPGWRRGSQRSAQLDTDPLFSARPVLLGPSDGQRIWIIESHSRDETAAMLPTASAAV